MADRKLLHKKKPSAQVVSCCSSNLASLIHTIYTHPVRYGDVSSRVLGYLHLKEPNGKRSIRWNVMRRWIESRGRAGAAVLRVTKIARDFFLKNASDVAFNAALHHRSFDDKFRFLMSPNHAFQFLEYIEFLSRVSTDLSIFLMILGRDTVIIESDSEVHKLIIAPKTKATETQTQTQTQTDQQVDMFSCRIGLDTLPLSFVSCEMKAMKRHNATAIGVFSDRLEFFRDEILVSSVRIQLVNDVAASPATVQPATESVHHLPPPSSLRERDMGSRITRAALRHLIHKFVFDKDVDAFRFIMETCGIVVHETSWDRDILTTVINQIQGIYSELGMVVYNPRCQKGDPGYFDSLMTHEKAKTVFEWLRLPLKHKIFRDSTTNNSTRERDAWMTAFLADKRWTKKFKRLTHSTHEFFSTCTITVYEEDVCWARFVPVCRSLRLTASA